MPESDSPFRACEVCHALICWRVQHHHGAAEEDGLWWETLPQPVSPIIGTLHQCGADGKDC